MIDLRERLQELADAATRQGATPGPADAIRRGRRRRRRIAAVTASLLAVGLVAGAAATGRLADQPDLPAVAPPTTAPLPAGPDVRHDLPGNRSTQDMGFEDLSGELRRCQGSASDRAELIGYVHSKEWHRVWMVAAKPPKPGATGLCWTSGLFEGGGAGVLSGASRPRPVDRPLTASGSLSTRFGTIDGQVVKRAVRVQVRFRDGRPPLQLGVVQSGDRYPVNFYIGFYPANGARGEDEWPPAEVAAFDAQGRQLARCTLGPPWNTPSACDGNG
jgi:hypothetical protein